MPGDCKTYLSDDSAISEEESVHYPIEFLHTVEIAGLLTHKLNVQVGMPVMLVRPLNPPRLMNGIRCIIVRAPANALFFKIIIGPYGDEFHVVPRVALQPSEASLPFTFVRKQFPVQPCFCIVINKAQGQTFKTVGKDLRTLVVSHGMICVALSRTG